MLGMGLPVIAGTLAKLHSAPEISAATEVGVFNWAASIDEVSRAPIGIADMNLHWGAGMVGDMVDALGGMVMGGNTETAFLTGAQQIDKFGNLNTWAWATASSTAHSAPAWRYGRQHGRRLPGKAIDHRYVAGEPAPR